MCMENAGRPFRPWPPEVLSWLLWVASISVGRQISDDYGASPVPPIVLLRSCRLVLRASPGVVRSVLVELYAYDDAEPPEVTELIVGLQGLIDILECRRQMLERGDSEYIRRQGR